MYSKNLVTVRNKRPIMQTCVQIPSMIQNLLYRYNDEEEEVLLEVWKALDTITSKMPKVGLRCIFT